MINETSNTIAETEIRTLSVSEIDDISGGVIDGGCIPDPFEDIFPIGL
ncbi:hypothetical protein [Fodinicurvata sp. EGI_FJ10296]|jgi:hypothetical protein